MKGSAGKQILVVATSVVIASAIAGIVIIGSPTEGRLQQLDSRRIADLRGIMSATDLFWSRNERLPRSLDELAEDPRTSVSTIDPGSGEAYSYRLQDEDTYELCATFDRASPEIPGRPTADFWVHPPGRKCFALDVDKSVR